MTGSVRFQEGDAIATVEIDRPPLNVMDVGMFQTLRDGLRRLSAEGRVRVVVMKGAGTRAFSAGAEVGDHSAAQAGAMLDAFHGALREIWDAPWVSIASVRGYCLGGGCELACFCDLTIASEDASFGQPEVNVGSLPPVAAAWWPRVVGWKRAVEICLTGRRLTAAEAREWGLVNQVHPAAALDEAVARLAADIASKSGAVLAQVRGALRDGCLGPDALEAIAKTEERYHSRLLPLADASEGVRAFLEKRPPRWGHR
ncbi:MAG: enoyl-CoA hydratase/isomerase family protein [Planctomycetes bacterium]|nr:enoyl-CoA hydratase/isomerase family protein [Planctomycetota bacterium]